MSPVTVVVHRIARLQDRVKTVRAGWTRNLSSPDVDSKLAWRRPDVGRKVRVRVVDSGVDHPNHVRCRSCGNIPCPGRADIRARMPAVLPGVLQSPKHWEIRVIRD